MTKLLTQLFVGWYVGKIIMNKEYDADINIPWAMETFLGLN